MEPKTAKRQKQWYIGERQNPQFSKPYYVAYGQLSKKAAAEKENGSLYGSMDLTPYETEEAYNKALESLKSEGFTVNVR